MTVIRLPPYDKRPLPETFDPARNEIIQRLDGQTPPGSCRRRVDPDQIRNILESQPSPGSSPTRCMRPAPQPRTATMLDWPGDLVEKDGQPPERQGDTDDPQNREGEATEVPGDEDSVFISRWKRRGSSPILEFVVERRPDVGKKGVPASKFYGLSSQQFGVPVQLIEKKMKPDSNLTGQLETCGGVLTSREDADYFDKPIKITNRERYLTEDANPNFEPPKQTSDAHQKHCDHPQKDFLLRSNLNRRLVPHYASSMHQRPQVAATANYLHQQFQHTGQETVTEDTDDRPVAVSPRSWRLSRRPCRASQWQLEGATVKSLLYPSDEEENHSTRDPPHPPQSL